MRVYDEPWRAYTSNPEFTHVYNRMDLHTAQGVAAWPLGVRPGAFPVVVVPVVDLSLGAARVVLRDAVDYDELVRETGTAGRFWTAHDGEEQATDVLLLDGAVRLEDTARVQRSAGGLLLWWVRDARAGHASLEFVQQLLAGYTGPASIVTRDDVVVDCVLRWGEQNCSWRRRADMLACVPHRFECGKPLEAPPRDDAYGVCWVHEDDSRMAQHLAIIEGMRDRHYVVVDGSTVQDGYVRLGIVGVGGVRGLERLASTKRANGWV